MRIAIVSTGDEILRGAVVDTNAAWIAAELHALGHETSRVIAVGDRLDDLRTAYGETFREFDLVIATGGLGPTEDDLAARAAAETIGVSLARDAEAERQVRAAFDRIGRPMAEVNLKQADLPEGCRVLDNPAGTAPGFEIRTPRGRAVFLPGVPREMMVMFDRHVRPSLPRLDAARHRAALRCFGMGESDIQTALADLGARFPGLRVGYRAVFPEIVLSFFAPSADILDRGVAEARSRLGRAVFADRDTDLPAALVARLAARGLTLAAAESCTGGLVGHAITETPGASVCFVGSIVAYSNEVKTSVLGVDAALVASKGAVSEEVARAMAEGARRTLGADIAVALTGIAGPDGGTPDKPVGLVHMAVADGRGTEHKRRVFQGLERGRVKRIAAWTAMRVAFDRIEEVP